jgi:hypothetical protein
MYSPTFTHWSAVKRILRYLNGSRSHGLLIQPAYTLTLRAYSDANWAGYLDDCLSISGYCIFLGNSLISWSSNKQQITSWSSTEAEYKSLALASAELVWVQYLLREFQVNLHSSPNLWCDNIRATYLASNPVFNAHTKKHRD